MSDEGKMVDQVLKTHAHLTREEVQEKLKVAQSNPSLLRFFKVEPKKDK